MYLSKPTLLCGLTFNCVKSQMKYIPLSATARGTEAEFGDIAEQTDVILKRIQHILEAEGGSLDNVVKITSFVTEISSEAGAGTHAVRVKYFGENLPASTRVQVAGLVEPHLKIEIEAIAVLPE